MARVEGRGGPIRRLAATVAVAPLILFIAVVGVRLGLIERAFAYEVLAWRVALWVAAAAAVAAVVAVVLAWRAGRARRIAAASLAVAAASLAVAAAVLAGFLVLNPAAAGPVVDVTSDPADPPGFAGRLLALRTAAGAVDTARPAGIDDGCDLIAVARQVAPGEAAYALERAGFDVLGFGVGRADGTRTSFWFGFAYDAVVRIRPGRTDVRVVARDARPPRGETCRLARGITERLQLPSEGA